MQPCLWQGQASPAGPVTADDVHGLRKTASPSSRRMTHPGSCYGYQHEYFNLFRCKHYISWTILFMRSCSVAALMLYRDFGRTVVYFFQTYLVDFSLLMDSMPDLPWIIASVPHAPYFIDHESYAQSLVKVEHLGELLTLNSLLSSQ